MTKVVIHAMEERLIAAKAVRQVAQLIFTNQCVPRVLTSGILLILLPKPVIVNIIIP